LSVPSFLARHCTILFTGEEPSLGPVKQHGVIVRNTNYRVLIGLQIKIMNQTVTDGLVLIKKTYFMDKQI